MSTHGPSTGHRVSDKPGGIHFPLTNTPGHVTCMGCGVTVEAMPDPYLDRWETLQTLWVQHRSLRPAAGRKGHPSREATPTAYVTALGTSKLSAAERGRMGVAAKRKKNPHLFRGGT